MPTGVARVHVAYVARGQLRRQLEGARRQCYG